MKQNINSKKVLNFVAQSYDKNNIAIFNLINKFFWKSKLALISMFGLPLLFMLVYFAVSSSGRSSFNVSSGFNLYISFSVMPISLVSLPQLLVEIKNSIILRRIAISNVSPFRYNFLMSTYFFVMCIISTIFIFIAVSAFENVNMKNFLDSFEILPYIYALLNFYIISISFGIILSSISKSTTWVQLIGLAIILFSLMLSGQFIPLQIISNIMPVKIISMFSPLDYALGLMNNVVLGGETKLFIEQIDKMISLADGDVVLIGSLNKLKLLFPHGGYNIFDFDHPFIMPNQSILKDIKPDFDPKKASLPIYDVWEKITNIIFPYLFLIGSTYLSINRFSWSSR